MTEKTIRGRFVWHELLTRNLPHAHNFYAKVIGWKVQPLQHDSNYQVFTPSSGPVAGTVHRPEGAASWLPFIGTTDIETTLGDIAQLGGSIIEKPVVTSGGGGKWALVKDPQGATFALYQSLGTDAAEKPPKRGEFSWHELATTDYEAAFEFYSKLFGWEVSSEVDMGPLGMYFMFGRNGLPFGGMFIKPPEMTADPNWCGYIRVKDMNRVVNKAKASGATLVNEPMEVPGGDWVAQLVDPQGALFAVHTFKADAVPTEVEGSASKPQQGALDFSIPPQTAHRTSATSKRTSESVTPAVKKKSKRNPKARPAKAAKKSLKHVAAQSTSKKQAPKKKQSVQRQVKKAPTRKGAKKAVKKASKSKTTARRSK